MNCTDLIIEIGRRLDKIPEAHKPRYRLLLGPGIYTAVVLAAQEAQHAKGANKRLPLIGSWSGVALELEEKYGPMEWRVV